MTDPNAWYDLAAHDQDTADAWDQCSPLPEIGDNEALDSFCARKHITLAALARMGARIGSDPAVIAFAFPGGIKYRNMESGLRWNYHGSEFTQLKIIRHGGAPVDTVIIAEGETDAARLTELYPFDVAVLPAGARRFTKAFADQVVGYRRVAVATDNDEAGDAGAAKIAEHVMNTVRLRPPAGDWCELAEVTPPEIPDLPANQQVVGTLVFEDIMAAFDGDMPRPEIIVDDMLYAEGVHWLSGHPGAGKSLMAMHLSHMVMLEQRHVVWLDHEQGPRMTGQRFREMNVPRETLAGFLHYVWSPKHSEDQLEAIVSQWPGALVVVDSASKALSSAGIDENSASEVTGWTVKFIAACKRHGFPVVVIDHVTKTSGEGKGMTDSAYARGSGAKLADADVHLLLSVVEPFKRDTAGVIKIRVAKDREACLPFTQFYAIGDGEGRLPILPTVDPRDNGEPEL